MSILRGICSATRLSSFASSSLFVRPIIQNQVRCVVLKPTCPPDFSNLSHDEKNLQLKRPMSPHLTIYKPQLTSMMSISHRMTGMALFGYAFLLSSCSFLPGDFNDIANWICNLNMPWICIFSTKFLIAFPFTYHFCNGIRHLMWDMGKGLTLKEVYKTGYVTLGAAAVAGLALSLL